MDREIVNMSEGNSAVTTQSTGRNSMRYHSSMRWQMMVTSGTLRSNPAGGEIPRMRVDQPHAISPPHMPLHWSSQVGTHVEVERELPIAILRPMRTSARTSKSQAVASDRTSRDESSPNASRPTAFGPNRPKMLGAIQNPSPHSNRQNGQSVPLDRIERDSNRPGIMPNLGNVELPPSMVELTGPLAFNIRNTLTSASQTLESIAQKVRLNSHVSLDDSHRLDATAQNLQVLSQWSDDILLSMQIEQDRCSLIRRRFRVRDWQVSLHNLLDEAARLHQIHIDWHNWGDALPNLYLDPSIISKAFYNLIGLVIRNLPTGSSVRFHVGLQSPATRHLMFTIQTDENVFSQEQIQIFNGSIQPVSGPIENTCIVTAKSIIALHGGMLTAHRDLSGGCDLRITLPTDSAESLTSSWLIRSFQQGLLFRDCSIQLHAVKLDGSDGELANTELQKAAGNQSLVIRISNSRWLILELKPVDRRLSSSTTVDRASAAMRLNGNRNRISKKLIGSHSSESSVDESAPVWLEDLVFQSGTINEKSFWNSESVGRRLPEIVDAIGLKIRELTSGQQLIVDGFQPVSRREERKVIESPDVPGAQVVSEIIRQWKDVQAKLVEVNCTRTRSYAG